MPVIIYMDDYRKAQESRAGATRRYDEDVLCVNWNPALQVMATACYQTPRELSPPLPESFSDVDIDAFLDRVYALATQV